MLSQKLLAVLMSVLTAISTAFGMLIPTGNPVAPADDFVPVLRFVATSDTHVILQTGVQSARIIKMLKSAYSIAESDSEYGRLDAAVFSGDLTDTGTRSQFMAFASTVNSVIKGDTEFLACVARNHDSSVLGKGSLSFFSEITGLPTDFHRVINGFHFIGLSTSPIEDVHYSDEQLLWLDAQLAEAATAAPGQPIFVFQHEHIYDTVYGSYPGDGWGVEYFTEILSKYPQVVNISGHSHYPANDPRAVWQGEFTAINDGGLAYFEFTVDDETSVHPYKSKSMAQMLVVEVDALNRVLVRVYDLTAEKFVYEYLLDNIAHADKSAASNQAKAAAAGAPVFTEGAEITYRKFANTFTFSVPQAAAVENDIVFLYRLTVKDSDGEVVASEWALSGYYFAQPPEKISFDSVLLKRGVYTVEVAAEDAWGYLSVPLTTEITV